MQAQQPSAENCLAKDLLMNDEDESDSEKAGGDVKNTEKSPKTSAGVDNTRTRKPGPKSRSKVEEKPKSRGEKAEEVKPKNDNLMLTADKMMTKELALLHAPVEVKHEIPEIKDVNTRHSTRNSHVSS